MPTWHVRPLPVGEWLMLMGRGGSWYHPPQSLLHCLTRRFGNRPSPSAPERPPAAPSKREGSAIVGPGDAFETIPGVEPTANIEGTFGRPRPGPSRSSS